MITELIDDYQSLCLNVTDMIDKSGYKVDYVREKLHMSKPGFYTKRKKGNFAPDELKKIMKIIRADEMEGELFEKIIAKHQNDELTGEKQTRKLILG
jgi:hypothetical protein